MKEFWPQNIEPDSNVRKKTRTWKNSNNLLHDKDDEYIASSSVCERKWQFCYFYRGFSTSVKTFLHETSRIIPYSPTILPFFVSCHHNLKTQRFLNVAYCPTGMCTTSVQNRDWKNAISQKGHWYSNLVTLTTDSGESPPKRNSRREGKCGLVKGLS